jgi:hypothetical protein
MKKDNKPLIVAIFLVSAGLLSAVFPFRTVATLAVSAHHGGAFLISTAKGAENTSALFGSRTTPAVFAVSGNNASSSKAAFSATPGVIEDFGYISSLSR